MLQYLLSITVFIQDHDCCFRLHDTFRNTSTYPGNHDNMELACDGVIMDMDYNPTKYVCVDVWKNEDIVWIKEKKPPMTFCLEMSIK